MQLLSVLMARSIWLIDIRDLNPRGRELRFTLFAELANKYDFSRYPYDRDDDEDDYFVTMPTEKEPGYKFIDGQFRKSNGEVITINLNIFDDGLVAETRSSTQDCDAFLEEVLQWAAQNHGIVYRPDMVRSKARVSELHVRPSHVLSNLNSQLARFAERLSSLVSISGGTIPFEVSGLTLAPDPTLNPRPSPFIFERAVGIPLSDNRFYTRAPLDTDQHLELLEELGIILQGAS